MAMGKMVTKAIRCRDRSGNMWVVEEYIEDGTIYWRTAGDHGPVLRNPAPDGDGFVYELCNSFDTILTPIKPEQ
jgi:hypothetical protein